MPILDRRKDRFIDDQDKRVSVGIDFPFSRTLGDGFFTTTKTTVESIKNNIKLLCIILVIFLKLLGDYFNYSKMNNSINSFNIN